MSQILFRACCLVVVCLSLAVSASGKGKSHHHGGGQPAPEWVPPGDWPAGARVNAFVQTYLESSIVAPLDAPVPPPRVALGALHVDFSAQLAAATTPTERALYSSAAGFCDLVARILDAREKQQTSLVDIRNTSNAVNPLDMPAAGVSGYYSWNLEDERARAQHRDMVQAQLKGIDRSNSFISFNLRNWMNQVPGYRKSIQAAVVDVNAAQIRFDRERSAPPPAAGKPAPPTPNSDDAEDEQAAPQGQYSDPVVGEWHLPSGSALTLGADHTVSGDRAGTWQYTGTTDGGRNYEIHWQNKDWVDYITLSGDNQTMTGKSRGQAIAYHR